jgi:hypothetical protein
MTHAPKCLKCGKPLPFQDAFDGSDSTPKPGDIAVCFECGEAMIFGGAAFRLPTQEEFSEMLNDPDFVRAMAAVALKNSKPGSIPEFVVFGDSGHATVLATEPNEICEMCGNMDECRSYGPRKADGERMRVCFPCARKDEAEMQRAFDERIEGRNPA